MKTDSFLNLFDQPPAAFRPAPFLVLNGEYQNLEAKKTLQGMIKKMKEVGYGSFYVHPRPGLVTEYLSPDWFRVIDWCLEAAKKNKMLMHLYDENTYPSGFAGGRVPAQHPETRVKYVKYQILRELPDPSREDQIISGYRILSESPLTLGEKLSDEELSLWTHVRHESIPAKPYPKGPVVVFYLNQMLPKPWYGDFPYVSLVDPKVTPAFIESTHEQYKKHYAKEFGKTILSIFMDEPNLPTMCSGSYPESLHISPYIFHQFLNRYGYDLKDHLAELFFNIGNYEKIRFDYYEILHDLWLENWAKPLERWAEKNHLAQTGHYLEHEWPAPYANPGYTHLLAHMQWPGTDMLLCSLLDGKKDTWYFMNDQQIKGREPHFTMYLKQCASIANQLGKERVICESWGAGGNDATFEDFKRMGDWLVVCGVNLLNPHMSMSTIVGTRKTDHPQFFSEQSSWFNYLKPLNDHLSRLCWIATQGRPENQILVLDPLTTGYLIAERSYSHHQPFKSLDNSYSELIQSLAEHHFDFDIGDEYVLEEFSKVKNGRIKFPFQSYQVLVWPEQMVHVRQATVKILEQFLSQGGKIYSLEKSAIKVNGEASELVGALQKRYSKQWIFVKDSFELVRELKAVNPPKLQMTPLDGIPLQSGGVLHLRRVLADGSEVYLIVNSRPEPRAFKVEVEGREVTVLDSSSGKERSMEGEANAGGKLSFVLNISGIGTELIWVKKKVAPKKSKPFSGLSIGARVAGNVSEVEFKRIAPVELNRLVLDFATMHLPNKKPEKDICLPFANDKIWKSHGFTADPWYRTIQYRRQIIDRNTFDSKSGFELEFNVEIAKGVSLKGIELAAERPDLFKVRVNGSPLSFKKGQRWIDQHLFRTVVGPLLKVGSNTISLTGKPFDIRMEPDQIYLLGDFAVTSDERGFHLEPARSLLTGSWKEQGFPFYDGAVDYVVDLPSLQRFQEKGQEGSLVLALSEWSGSLIEVRHGGKAVRQIFSPPYQIEVTPLLKPNQSTELTLRVIGTPKNLFGPFHDPNKNRKITGQWLNGPAYGPIAGKEYDLLDYGILKAPQWMRFS